MPPAVNRSVCGDPDDGTRLTIAPPAAPRTTAYDQPKGPGSPAESTTPLAGSHCGAPAAFRRCPSTCSTPDTESGHTTNASPDAPGASAGSRVECATATLAAHAFA